MAEILRGRGCWEKEEAPDSLNAIASGPAPLKENVREWNRVNFRLIF
jgi:hypothetical protein